MSLRGYKKKGNPAPWLAAFPEQALRDLSAARRLLADAKKAAKRCAALKRARLRTLRKLNSQPKEAKAATEAFDAVASSQRKPRRKPVRRVFGRLKGVKLDVAEEAAGPVWRDFTVELTREGLRLRKFRGRSWLKVSLADVMAAVRFLRDRDAAEKAALLKAVREDERQFKMDFMDKKTQAQEDLFATPQGKSPRLKWKERHGIETKHAHPDAGPEDECPETGKRLWPWLASDDNFRHSHGGATEDEAMVALAKARGFRSWTEEGAL